MNVPSFEKLILWSGISFLLTLSTLLLGYAWLLGS